MYEKGVPLRGVHVRSVGKNGFRAIDAIRLDTGLMVKLIGEFGEVDPLRPFVSDIIQRQVLGAEIEYKVGPNKTGPETVADAVARKRAEGKDPAAEIPADFRAGYTMTETHCVSPDKAGGPYRVFEAEVGSTRRRAKIVARIPDPDRVREIRMALRASTDRNGNRQYDGIYMGDVGEDPAQAFRTDEAPAPPAGEAPPAPRGEGARGKRHPALIDGWRRVRAYQVIKRENPVNGVAFMILRARDLDNDDDLRLYVDVPDGDADRDLLFRETSRTETDWAVELRGEVAVGAPEAAPPDPPAVAPPDPPAVAPPAAVTGPPSGPDPSGRLMRIIYDPDRNHAPSPSYETIHRKGGSVQYFTIFMARDLDSGKVYKAKLYLPEKNADRELRLHLDIVLEGGRLCLRNSSAHPPPEVARMDFEKEPWERHRVMGRRPITQVKMSRDSDEVYHIFDAVIVGKKEQMKIMGHVPGGDTERLMTVLVRPNKWRHGELQYEAALIEPDPVVTTETMCEMIRKLKAPGIADEQALKIANRFGMESLHVIRYEPDRLIEISGIGPGTVAQIKAANHIDLSAAILEAMTRNGVHTRYFSRILRTFDRDAVEIIETDPYRLTQIDGISFEYADNIAVRNQKLSPLSPVRIEAALAAVVKSFMNSGKCGEEYVRIKERLFDITKPVGWLNSARFGTLIREHIEEQSGRGDGTVRLETVNGTQMVRFQEVLRAERTIAEQIYRRRMSGPNWIGFDPSQFLKRFQAEEKITLGAEQVDAVRMVCRSGTAVMTGGPGVGKTTTLKAAVAALESAGIQVILGAPTGIASKRMQTSTDRPASTVHSLIGQLDRTGEREPLISDNAPSCLVIDESSMVNVFTLRDLLKDLPEDTSILFCGDVDQLPSIGPGEILRDLIRSDMIPVTRLVTVYRSGNESGIVAAAQAINRGEIPRNAPDFQITEARTPEEIRDETIRQVQALRDGSDLDLLRDLMILSPTKKGPAGVVSLNTHLQELLNPAAPGKAEFSVPRPPEDLHDDDDDTPLTPEELKRRRVHHEILRVGDKVINTRNDKTSGLVNGDTGFITHVDPVSRTICVEFDDVPHIFEKDDLKDIRLAYAMTVHKSQGSEARHVILPLPDIKILLTRPLLYTGVTRGKSQVSVIGEPDTIRFCVHNVPDRNPKLRRYSTLAAQCRHLMEHGLEMGETEEEREPEPF